MTTDIVIIQVLYAVVYSGLLACTVADWDLLINEGEVKAGMQ